MPHSTRCPNCGARPIGFGKQLFLTANQDIRCSKCNFKLRVKGAPFWLIVTTLVLGIAVWQITGNQLYVVAAIGCNVVFQGASLAFMRFHPLP